MTPENASDEERFLLSGDRGFGLGDHAVTECILPVLPSTLAECCVDFRVDDDNSVWSRSTRVASLSWDWDDPGPSPRASSSCTSLTSAPICRSSAISFIVGESARPEFSSPHSPGFFSSSLSHANEDDLDVLLENSEAFADLQLVMQEETVQPRRSRAPVPSMGRSGDTQKEVINPANLGEGEFDYQGIPWPRFSISRNDYRSKRVREYSNYNNVNWTSQLEMRRRLEITRIEKVRNNMFLFNETFRTVNPSIDHFQLRQLLWNTSNKTSYLVSNSTLYAFNKKTRVARRVHATNPQQLACCHVDHGLAATGSFDSEVKVSKLSEIGIENPRTTFNVKVSNEPNSISNHVVIVNESRIVVANNDAHVTELDLSGNSSTVSKIKWIAAVNHVSVSPIGNHLMCLTGDSCEISLIDRRSGVPVAALSGHLDFSFCSSWSSENVVCTGSQDGTCRVWDVRNASQSVACIGSLLGAVRCAKFSPDGRFLAMSEPADFVHVYDVESGFRECQLLDFFGNIGGIAFSPDSSKLSISLADTMFGCLIDFQVGYLPLNTTR